MKKIQTIAIALIVTLGTLNATAQNIQKKVDASKSKITWKGYKVGGSHEGTIDLKEGTLIFKKEKLAGGSFTIYMNSISTTDLTGEYKEKLDGHLKSEDFFGTEKYSTSKLVFKKIASKGKGVYTVTADLTIKDKTNSVSFDITINRNQATTAFKIDRSKYNVKYASDSFFDNLGDKAISNNFDLVVELQF